MRIGIDAWGLAGATLHTGMGQYARHLITGLSERAELVAYGAPDEPRPSWLPGTVTWRTPAAPGPAKAAAFTSRLFALKSAAASDALDVFHAPATHLRPSMPPVPSVRCPVVTTVHDLIPLTHYGRDLPLRLRIFYRWNLRRALRSAAVITVSEAAKRDLFAFARIPADRVVAIANGVEFEPNPATGPLDRLGVTKPYVLYAGSYEPRKNLLAALSAFAELLRRGASYQLVAVVEASSGHAAAVHQRARSLALGDRVCFVHSVPDDDLRALYTHAEALLFPSLAEGFGFPPLQAAACGTPVVASDLDVIHETMDDAAVYVDPASVASMVDGMRRLLADAALRQGVIAAGSHRARLFSWRRSIEAHMAVFEAARG